MNTHVSDNIVLNRNAEPVVFDVVRSLPRRVTGFATMVETGLPLEALETSIAEVAQNTAFRLASLEIIDENPAEGGRLVRAVAARLPHGRHGPRGAAKREQT